MPATRGLRAGISIHQDGADPAEQRLFLKWLVYIIIRSAFQPPDQVERFAQAGQKNERDGCSARVLPDSLAEVVPREPWHHDVAEDQVEVGRGEGLEPLVS